MMCNDNCIGEAGQRIFERVKDNNGTDFNSHLLKHARYVSEKYPKIIGNGLRRNNRKRKVAEALLIRELKIQDQPVLLQLFS